MSENCGPTDAHADHDVHGMGCAEVIAEVWTLPDGECGNPRGLRPPRGLPGVPGGYGLEERIKALPGTIAPEATGPPEGLRERLG